MSQDDLTKEQALEVLKAVQETDRGPKGASVMSIKKYLVATYRWNLITEKQKLFKFIRDSVASKLMIQVTGSGGTGSVRLDQKGKDALANNATESSSSTSEPMEEDQEETEAKVKVHSAKDAPEMMAVDPAPTSPPTVSSTSRPKLAFVDQHFVNNAPASPSPKLMTPNAASVSHHNASIKVAAAAAAAVNASINHQPIEHSVSVPVFIKKEAKSQIEVIAIDAEEPLRQEIESLRAKLQGTSAEKANLEKEYQRLLDQLSPFRDEKLHPGDFCRNCFQSSDPEKPNAACCSRKVYYCCLACQHKDWHRHRLACTSIKHESDDE